LLSIPASVVAIIYFFGVVTSLNFAWVHSISPYIQTIAAIAVVMWLGLFAVDYIGVRRAARAMPTGSSAPIDLAPLVEAEAQTRSRAIEAVYNALHDNVGRTNQSINDLLPKPEPTLKQRTTQLATELFSLVSKQGPEPPHPLSNRGTEKEQREAMSTYFEWKGDTYWKYMAEFRDRVVRIDLELAAARIFTKLEEEEIDPPRAKREVDVKKIAETLLLVANQMPQ